MAIEGMVQIIPNPDPASSIKVWKNADAYLPEHGHRV